MLQSGRVPLNPPELISSHRFSEVMQTLKQAFDVIVIDSPPVLATDDAPCLGSYTDGAFMVVRASFTSSRMVVEALDRLRRRNVKVLGMLYNFAPRSTDYYWRYNRDYHSANGAADLSALGTAATAAGEGPPADKS